MLGRAPTGLEARIVIGMIDVDRAHLDAVFARVAHELRRSIKTHRLRVEQRRREYVWIAALDPGRCIDEEREARRVALGKAVFAEALDLMEAALGEFALVAFGDHAVDHLALEGADGADTAERRHGAAQFV